MNWVLGYNTNGFAHHRLDDVVEILHALGYGGISITPDVQHLDPFAPDAAASVRRIEARLRRFSMRSVIETGARFLLDPRRKHYPTLLEDDAGPRLRLLKRCVDIAAALGSDAVSFWSGRNFAGLPEAFAFDRLADRVARLVDHAAQRNVVLAFEPEPGMLVETVAGFRRLNAKVGGALKLALDVGHLVVTGEGDVADSIRASACDLATVHLEDMRKGVHEHLPFGEGEIDFGPVLGALDQAGFTGVASVELSRSSHDAVETARRSIGFLNSRRAPARAPEP